MLSCRDTILGEGRFKLKNKKREKEKREKDKPHAVIKATERRK